MVDGINLSRAKSPLSPLSRPLSPISTQLLSPLTNSNLSSNNAVTTKNRSKSTTSIRHAPSDKKEQLDETTIATENSNVIENKIRKTKSQNTLKEQEVNYETESLKEPSSNQTNDLNESNLIKILSQNIIELTENLNLLFSEQKNNQTVNNQIKSNETKKDNDLIEKIDQLREVSKKLQDCTQVKSINQKELNQHQIQITNLADQSNLVEQTDLVDRLQIIEPEFAECRSTFIDQDQLDKVQIEQQLIMQHQPEQPKYDDDMRKYDFENCDEISKSSSSFDDDSSSQFNDKNKDKKLRKANKSKIESQDDEFYECINEEQKDLRRSLFKGSKLNLEQLIDKAIDEQLLGQWLKLSDSLDNEDGPVQPKHSIEELKQKFATKLAIIHYKLYQKYSKTKPINVKKWRHRNLNKYNKIQSKYTLLQGLMDDDQFIQFLMDKINYFMRKIRQCKTQRKEFKKSQSKLNLNRSSEFFDCNDEEKKQNKDNLDDKIDEIKNNESIVDENNNKIEEQVLDENNNLIANRSFSADKLDQGNSSIEQEMNKLNAIKNELKDEFINELKEELIKDLNEELIKEIDNEQILDKANDEDEELKGNERKGLSKYAILFIFTLIIFMILIVLFRWISFEEVKKCTNCVRNLDSNQLILKPVSQLKQTKYRQQPSCDQWILIEAQKLLEPKN